MADTIRTLASLQSLLADNTAGDISAQDLRDFLVSVYPQIGDYRPEVYGTWDSSGTSDSDSALQAAIDAAHAATGGIVRIGAGTFKLGTTITLYGDVQIHGAGRYATILKSSAATIMFEHAPGSPAASEPYDLLYNLTLDGNSTGTKGLHTAYIWQWSCRAVEFKNFTTTGVHLEGSGEIGFYDCNWTTCVTGVKAGLAAAYQSNLVNFYNCRWSFNTSWALDWDSAAGVNIHGGNFENNGTTANDSTGVIRITNACPNGEGPCLSIIGGWAEANKGFAFLHLGAPSADDARAILRDTITNYNSGNLKYGVYVDGSGNRNRLLTEGCTFGDNSIQDVTLSDAGAYWEQGPTIYTSVDTTAGYLASWGDSFTGPSASWHTLVSENCDGVTAPAQPAGLTCSTNMVTSATNPLSSPNCLLNTQSSNDEETAFFLSQDGHSGNARVTCAIRFDSSGAGYREIDVSVRESANTGDPDRYEVVIEASGDTPNCYLYKRISSSGTLLAGPVGALAADTWYLVTCEANGTTIIGRVQRVSDGFWLNSGGTFQSGAADFASVTDSAITGQGYGGISIYRESGSTPIRADDLLFEAYY